MTYNRDWATVDRRQTQPGVDENNFGWIAFFVKYHVKLTGDNR